MLVHVNIFTTVNDTTLIYASKLPSILFFLLSGLSDDLFVTLHSLIVCFDFICVLLNFAITN